MRGRRIMEVEFDEAVKATKFGEHQKYLKRKEKKIAKIFFILMAMGCVFSIIDYYFRSRDIFIFYGCSLMLVVIAAFLYTFSKFQIWNMEKRILLGNISFFRKKSKLGKLIFESKELKNLIMYHVPRAISRKTLIGITLPSGNIPEIGFVSEEFKKFERQYGPGKCYSFSTLFHSIPKSYAKFSNLPVEKKLKDGRIKNPGIERVIRKLKPRWLDPKKRLDKKF